MIENGTILFDEASGAYHRIDSYGSLQHAYFCTEMELTDDGEFLETDNRGYWLEEKGVEKMAKNQ